MGPPIRLAGEQDARGRHRQVWSIAPGRRVTIVTAAPPGDPTTDALIASEIIPALERAAQSREEAPQ